MASVARSSSHSASLTWSNSQQRQLDDCARARYWAVEVARQGWRPHASELAVTARRLKSLRSLEGEVGRVLHERAAERANALKVGAPLPSLARMRQQASAAMRYVVYSSRERHEQWLQAPEQVPMLADAHYRTGPTREQMLRARERLECGVITLHQLGLWAEVAAADPGDIVCVDARQSYRLPDPDGGPPVTVWAAPDLIYRADHEVGWVVCDHKSASPRDARAYRAHMEQVTSYIPMLRHGLRLLAPDAPCRARLVLLSDGSEEEWEVSPEEIDAAEARMRAGARAMAALRAEADHAEADAREQLPAGTTVEQTLDLLERARRSAYPMTAARGRCRYCNYRQLCAPEQEAELVQLTRELV
jgi:hypothetical protein